MTEAKLKTSETPLEQPIVQELATKVAVWDQEIATVLPASPRNPHIYWFSNGRHLDHRIGVGGFAYAAEELSLWFDPEFENKDQQLEDLHGVYFHEKYHLVQGWVELSDQCRDIPAMGYAIFEGAAVVFARQYANYHARNGQYPEDQIQNWLKEVKDMSQDYKDQVWRDGYEDNILYAVGTYVVENALLKNPDLTIIDLATKHWQEILDLSCL